jgi:hypothetical protein
MEADENLVAAPSHRGDDNRHLDHLRIEYVSLSESAGSRILLCVSRAHPKE